MLTVTNTTANRENEKNVDKFLELIKRNSFNRMFDFFCGSGSFIFYGMARKIAREYYINDAYEPIICLFNAIKTDPNRLKKEYAKQLESTNAQISFFANSNIELLANQELDPFKKAVLWLTVANLL
jgi:site-specific DNA-adenine methylase